MVSTLARGRTIATWLSLVMTLAVPQTGCGGGSPATPGPASPAAHATASDRSLAVSPAPSSIESPGPRPASDATIRITSPRSGQTVHGPSVRVVIRLDGAHIVPATTTDIRPDEGHVHLYVDNSLVSMNYGLEQDLDLAPGTWFLRAEFVAADHAPFSPRVVSQDVLVIVK